MTANSANTETQTKIRVQFEFTPEALQRLDELKAATGASTRAETIRDALRLYEWFVDVADRNSTIKIVDENNEVVSQFKAKLLLK
jgi:metal-responsive CopG/Arc/MetJ family transcriptional regulator